MRVKAVRSMISKIFEYHRPIITTLVHRNDPRNHWAKACAHSPWSFYSGKFQQLILYESEYIELNLLNLFCLA